MVLVTVNSAAAGFIAAGPGLPVHLPDFSAPVESAWQAQKNWLKIMHHLGVPERYANRNSQPAECL
jgi:hypothetical protein